MIVYLIQDSNQNGANTGRECRKPFHSPFVLAVNIIIFLHPMVLRYILCDFELPNPEKKLYPSFLQIFLHDLILYIPYPGKFPYPIKSSILKSAYFFESGNNQKQKLSGLNDYLYVPFPFLV